MSGPVDDPIALLVLGGGPAGQSAATAYRDAGGSGPVTILSAEDAPPYTRPALSKEYLRGETGEGTLPMTDADFYRQRDIGVELGESAVELDTAAHTVRTDWGRVLRYRSLMLATGASPALPDLPGVDGPAVHTLRSLASARKLRAAAESAGQVVVVGAGFVGCEAAVSLARRGLRVDLVHPDPLPQHDRLGPAVGEQLASWLVEENVRLLPNQSLRAVRATEQGTLVRLNRGATRPADLVLLATGIAPRSGLAQAAGIDVAGGRIRTDARMRTSAPGVYAAGDVALARHGIAGRSLPVEHWGDALAMGAVAGRTAAGADATWIEAPGFWSVIGDRVLKYVAWGDGFDEAVFTAHRDGGFTVCYGSGGAVVGVLTHGADDNYECGAVLVRGGARIHAGGRL